MNPSLGGERNREGRVVAGKYQLVRLLGAGGMGEVYEARHAVVGRRFALKFLRPELTANTDIVSRFQREAQAAGALENENIAAVVDTGVDDDGAPFLVMEFLEGEDLSHLLLRQGPLPVPRAVNILIQACRGLMAAHAKGIVHRDLKPENLYICQRNDGTDFVKVLDFGIAKLHVGTSMTQTGTTMGTPHYMSLEQARGAKEVDHRTDIYALGVILYEILSGTKPHPGDNYNEILYHVISQEPGSLDSLRPGLPPGLAAVVQKAMAREVEDRYASVAEFMAGLIPFAERTVTPLKSMVNLPVEMGATLATAGSLRGVSVPPSSPTFSDAGGDLVLKRSVGVGKVGAVLAAVGAIAVVVWLVFSGQDKESSAPRTAPAPKPIPPIAVPTASPPSPVEPVPPPPAESPVPEAAVPEAASGSAEPATKKAVPRSARHRKARRTTRSATPAAPTKVIPAPAPPRESLEPPPPPPRRRGVRAIDRKNPFAD